MSTSSAPFACAARAWAGDGRYGKSARASDSSSSTVFAMPPTPWAIMLAAQPVADQRKGPGTPVSSQAVALRHAHCRRKGQDDTLLGSGVAQLQAGYATPNRAIGH